MIDLGGGWSFKPYRPTQYWVLTLEADLLEVKRHTDSRTWAQNSYERVTTHPKWLVDVVSKSVIETTFPPYTDEELSANRDRRQAAERADRERAKKETAARKAAKEALRMPKPGNDCECGCGGITGGGRYLPGHDAKHKSALITAAMAGDEGAYLVLESKQWLHFLHAKINGHTGLQAKVQAIQTRVSSPERLEMMMLAHEIVRNMGRHRRDLPGFILVTPVVAEALVLGHFDEVFYDELRAGGVDCPEAGARAARVLVDTEEAN